MCCHCRDTPAFTPGPGSYKAGSTFSRLPAKRSWHMQGQPKAKSALPKGPHLPPSVPSKAQSYGYAPTPAVVYKSPNRAHGVFGSSWVPCDCDTCVRTQLCFAVCGGLRLTAMHEWLQDHDLTLAMYADRHVSQKLHCVRTPLNVCLLTFVSCGVVTQGTRRWF